MKFTDIIMWMLSVAAEQSLLPLTMLKCKIYIFKVLLEGPEIFEHHLSLKLQASPC